MHLWIIGLYIDYPFRIDFVECISCGSALVFCFFCFASTSLSCEYQDDQCILYVDTVLKGNGGLKKISFCFYLYVFFVRTEK